MCRESSGDKPVRVDRRQGFPCVCVIAANENVSSAQTGIKQLRLDLSSLASDQMENFTKSSISCITLLVSNPKVPLR